MANVQAAVSVMVNGMQVTDIETALLAVQSDRAQKLENQLMTQMKEVQAKNDRLAMLNELQVLVTDLKGKFADGAKADSTIAQNPETTKRPGDIQTSSAVMNLRNALQAAGMNPFQVPQPKLGAIDLVPTTVKKGDLETLAGNLKSEIDSLGNSQQMDMLRLQSLSNKRNEAYDIMTNFIKKMHESRSSIIGNMR